MIAPTRALVVEDIDTWVYTLTRAAHSAGASEVIPCSSLQAVRDSLRSYRFDIAILDIGLDPDVDVNADGIQALKAIRDADGNSTRCVLVTGWQGGDRLAMHAQAQQEHGVDFAFMKEKYDAPALIAKLSELLATAPQRRQAYSTAMASLCAKVEPPFLFENWLLSHLSPTGGIKSLYTLSTTLLNSVTPAVAKYPEMPLEKGPDGICAGLYWSRALGSAIGIGLAPATTWAQAGDAMPAVLARMLPDGGVPVRVANVHEKNIAGRVWEIPGIDRDQFPDV